MKILLFKSKMCGSCKMFQPQLKKACEILKIQYIPVDVEQNQTFKLWENISTVELIQKFNVYSSGKAVCLLDETKNNGLTIIWDKPINTENILKNIKAMK